jgi:hypothetical protein
MMRPGRSRLAVLSWLVVVLPILLRGDRIAGQEPTAQPAQAGQPGEATGPGQPSDLQRPPLRDFELPPPVQAVDAPVEGPFEPALGFSGRSSVRPSVGPNWDFLPMEDRWRIGFPEWDRYQKDHPPVGDYPYSLGRWWDPFNLNVLKGDYPIIGQHTFLDITVSSLSIMEARQIPTATTPFESTTRPAQEEFFGRPNQFIYSQYMSLSVDLFHGDAAFKPVDWRVKVTPVANYNNLSVEEDAVVNPDVTRGTARNRTYVALQEAFVEAKLADLSPEYDFLSVRVGNQPFTSDFRGQIFSDTNRAARLFGTLNGNRDQFNLVYFDQLDKDTNSFLNTYRNRQQDIVIANWYHQDFIFPGYTIEGSVHYNNDHPSMRFDANHFLVRPDPDGVFQQHRVEVYYLGFAGEGHIDHYNISHAFYWALGHDSLNPLANQPQDISAQLATAEVSYDRDWARFRSAVFWASGDGNINNRHATGFDTILDNPAFAGGEFSFWQRQNIPLFGVNLVNRFSLVPDLRASKFQGQANFVNPGLLLVNGGIDLDLTPRLRMINNVNFLWFDKTNVLEQFVYQAGIPRWIGTDLAVGFEYRPLLSNNVIFVAGVNALVPGDGFQALYNSLNSNVSTLWSGFLEMTLTF